MNRCSGTGGVRRSTCICFFFSSRRRHTRFDCDWSSDVCSSDLMKRFVLLDEPGKATISANPSGRPIVRCETPGGTVEMQVGGAETHDNVAFLPLELRETTDSTSASARQINMGLVREESDWKLLSLGVLLLDLPALEVEWDESEIEATEKDALESLKMIAEAIESYRSKYPDRKSVV